MCGTKCRLCLKCLRQEDLSCSLANEHFLQMIGTIFPFWDTAVQTIDSQPCKIPDLVCLQCSAKVEDFFKFSGLVEANQKKLHGEYFVQEAESEIDNLNNEMTAITLKEPLVVDVEAIPTTSKCDKKNVLVHADFVNSPNKPNKKLRLIGLVKDHPSIWVKNYDESDQSAHLSWKVVSSEMKMELNKIKEMWITLEQKYENLKNGKDCPGKYEISLAVS
ncbi:uncharacterized protein LOC131262588 [Anopheles coustani]|uniref:uncharacterized protein LOC131262588 n=1 Tax=Anopheles coustani TaxID=139045 RepID=UPI0026581470|nr:uncharacterized protein LOC131262588 [Anopheles coustani]